MVTARVVGVFIYILFPLKRIPAKNQNPVEEFTEIQALNGSIYITPKPFFVLCFLFLFHQCGPASPDQAECQSLKGWHHVVMSTTPPEPAPMQSRVWSCSDLQRGVQESSKISAVDLNLLSREELLHRLQDRHNCFPRWDGWCSVNYGSWKWVDFWFLYHLDQ